jgi:surface carbohydrate biosynthesis protein
MKANAGTTPPVVLLVDNRTRDLDQAALIAHHLGTFGVRCILEPLESFRAVLAAHRPGMIIFNHLLASHLVEWSKRLADIGVLTAVLSNEGMFRRPDILRFNSGQFYGEGHVDYFFCWNKLHREALLKEGFYREAKIEVVGVPRFDFYFEPWSRVVYRPPAEPPVRPRVLACGNFGLASFWESPREYGDRFFAGWAARMPLYRDYWGAIESHWKSQRKFLEYLGSLAATGKYDITLRPHPNEDRKIYEAWASGLHWVDRGRVQIDSETNISALMLGCDIEISGESCTTAVEAWIANKPGIELLFDRLPMLYSEDRSKGNIHCDSADDLPAMVAEQLNNPSPPELREIRRDYLEKWCATPNGSACRRIAEIAAFAVKTKRPADWSKLNANDKRRAAKLKLYNRLGHAYHFDPLLSVKHFLFRDRYAGRDAVYRKSIKPRDVAEARSRLNGALHVAAA